MVRCVIEGPLSKASSARQFNITPKTVAEWVERFRAEGVVAGARRSARDRLTMPPQFGCPVVSRRCRTGRRFEGGMPIDPLAVASQEFAIRDRDLHA
jgi:transposase-like protein